MGDSLVVINSSEIDYYHSPHLSLPTQQKLTGSLYQSMIVQVSSHALPMPVQYRYIAR